MQNKKYAGLVLFSGLLIASSVFLFSSNLPSSTEFSNASVNNWIDKTGDAFSAPACGSSNLSTPTCNGTNQINVSISISNANSQMYEITNWRMLIDGVLVCKFQGTAPSGSSCGWTGTIYNPVWNGVLSNTNHSYEIRSLGAHTAEAEEITGYEWSTWQTGAIGAQSCGAPTPTPTATATPTPTPTPTPTAVSGKTVTLSASPASIVQNSGDLSVTWNFISGSPYCNFLGCDWIGMFLAGAGDGAWLDWVYASGNSSGTVNFTSNVPPGTYEFRYFEATVAGGSKLATSNQVSITAAPTPTPTTTATPTPTATPTSSPTPTPAFNFDLTNGGPRNVTQGQSVQNIITATLISGITELVGFSISGLPSGATHSFSLNSCNPTCNTILTISAALSTPTGTYPIVVTGSSPSLTKQTSFNLIVNQAPPCADGQDNDGDGFVDSLDPSCTQSNGTTEFSACNDKNSDGTLRDNDGDGIANIFDPGCHSDGNPNNPASYNPNDNDESNTIFKEVLVPFQRLLAMLFSQ